MLCFVTWISAYFLHISYHRICLNMTYCTKLAATDIDKFPIPILRKVKKPSFATFVSLLSARNGARGHGYYINPQGHHGQLSERSNSGHAVITV